MTPYIDSWLTAEQKVEEKQEFHKKLAEGINKALSQIEEPVQVVFFSCSPMDEEYTQKIAALIDDAVIFDNSQYLSHDIQAVMKKCGLLVGMRFHSLILSSSVHVPIAGLIYAPKVRDLFSLLECQEYSLELSALTPETLAEMVSNAWNERDALGQRQSSIIESLRDSAFGEVKEISQKYFGS